MDYTTLCAESKQDQEQVTKRMHSLYEVCQQLVDGRKARGKRYDLASLLLVLVLAKLAAWFVRKAGRKPLWRGTESVGDAGK